jgi:hypothetical protein
MPRLLETILGVVFFILPMENVFEGTVGVALIESNIFINKNLSN